VKLALPLSLWLVAGFAAPSIDQTPPSPQGGPGPAVLTSAVLVGQVVDAETGQPVEDASVTLTGRPAPARGRAAAPAAGANFFDLMMAARGGRGSAERIAAGANGRFVVRGLPVAVYTVRAEAPGYLGGSVGLGRPGGSESLEIREGQTTARVTIRLWKQAILTGVVVDEAGEPVIGASVRAYRRSISRFGVMSYVSARPATTDDRGAYRLFGLEPGEYLVLVPQSQSTFPAAAADAVMQGLFSGQMPEGGLGALGRGGASPMNPRAVRVGEWRLTSENVLSPAGGEGALLAYRTVFFPSALSPADATWVALRSGEERGGVDFALRPVATGRVTGVVTGLNGPVANVPIRLAPAGDRRAGEPSSLDVAEGQTSADGRFTLLAVPPGQYRVIAERETPPDLSVDLPEEFASNPIIQMAIKMRGGGATPLFGEATVTVGPGEPIDIAIAATEGVKLTGRLEFEGGPAPAPNAITRAVIALRSLDAGPTLSRTVRPGADGTFTATGLMPGRYALTCSLASEGAWIVKLVTATGRDVTTAAIVVEDKDVTDVVARLTNQVGTLRGTVRRSASAARGAGTSSSPTLLAVAVPADYLDWTDFERIAERVSFASVSEDGSFRIGPMLPGEYLVAVVDEAQMDPGGGAALLRSLAPQATRVTVGAGDGNSVTLPVVSVR
jgi:hypothetical protein